MAVDANWTTICPHCGAASEDDAICRACGKLLDESQPVRPFSSGRLVANLMAPGCLPKMVRFLSLSKKNRSFVQLGIFVRETFITRINKDRRIARPSPFTSSCGFQSQDRADCPQALRLFLPGL